MDVVKIDLRSQSQVKTVKLWLNIHGDGGGHVYRSAGGAVSCASCGLAEVTAIPLEITYEVPTLPV